MCGISTFGEGTMGYGRKFMALASLTAALAACDSDDTTGPGGGRVQGPQPSRVVEANGDLTASLTEYRAALGEPANGGGTGPQPGGRREIRWDAVPAEQTNTDAFPADFFRGAGLNSTTDGTGLRVSDNDFGDVNPSYAEQFESFSKVKTFMATGSARMTLTFRLAGTDTPAVVNGFGIVFSDVDREGSAYIDLFDAAGATLGRYLAPARADAAGHSFIGVVYDHPLVARVEVTSGEAALAAGREDVSSGGTQDLVVTDDFLYGEPQPGE
jgi:hypothetical protein